MHGQLAHSDTRCSITTRSGLLVRWNWAKKRMMYCQAEADWSGLAFRAVGLQKDGHYSGRTAGIQGTGGAGGANAEPSANWRPWNGLMEAMEAWVVLLCCCAGGPGRPRRRPLSLDAAGTVEICFFFVHTYIIRTAFKMQAHLHTLFPLSLPHFASLIDLVVLWPLRPPLQTDSESSSPNLTATVDHPRVESS